MTQKPVFPEHAALRVDQGLGMSISLVLSATWLGRKTTGLTPEPATAAPHTFLWEAATEGALTAGWEGWLSHCLSVTDNESLSWTGTDGSSLLPTQASHFSRAPGTTESVPAGGSSSSGHSRCPLGLGKL